MPIKVTRAGFVSRAGLHYGESHCTTEKCTPEVNAARFANLTRLWQGIAEGRIITSKKGIKRGKQVKRNKAEKKFMDPKIRLQVTAIRDAREIQDRARTMAQAAMDRAFQVLSNPNSQDSAALQAAELVLNRAYGKPNQTNTNLNVDANGKLNEISGAELNQRIKEALKRVEDITGRERQAPQSKKQSANLRKLDRNTHGPDEPVH